MRFVFIIFYFALMSKVICDEDKREKYCRDGDRLNITNEFNDYLIVDAEIKSMIILECKFCDEEIDQSQMMIWYWQRLNETSKLREVELGMENDPSLNRLFTTIDNALVIRGFLKSDGGLYRCIDPRDNDTAESKYNYRLEPVFKNDSAEPPEEGDMSAWEIYRDENFNPVALKLSTSEETEFVNIRNDGVLLELTSEWGRWSPCKDCKSRKGVKKRKAMCRIKSNFIEEVENKDMSPGIKYLKKTPLIPCRSMILEEYFPLLSNVTRRIPDFIVTEKCKKCKKNKKKKKFKYKRRYVLKEGTNLNIACPEAKLESNVVWRKENMILEKGKGHSFRKGNVEPRVLVDIFYSIYLKGVSKFEQGNYTCYVDDIRMLQAKIIVIPESKILTGAFVRHFYILSFVLFLSLISYCYVIIKACKNRKLFKIQTYEQLKEEKKLLDETEDED